MKRGDIVKTLYATGLTKGPLTATTLLGVVVRVGPKTFTVLWESGFRNRLNHGHADVKVTTDADLIAEASPNILAESKRLKADLKAHEKK